jgi:hypothetical protein
VAHAPAPVIRVRALAAIARNVPSRVAMIAAKSALTARADHAPAPAILARALAVTVRSDHSQARAQDLARFRVIHGRALAEEIVLPAQVLVPRVQVRGLHVRAPARAAVAVQASNRAVSNQSVDGLDHVERTFLLR